MSPEPSLDFEFGGFRLEGGERRLWRDGAPVALTDKVFDLLVLLVKHRGRALGKVELMEQLWPDTVVQENNLSVNISLLRKALGENASQRRYIETLPRRGYRFVAEVRQLSPSAPPSMASEPHAATFVGREHELARLTHYWARAVSGQGRVVFVSGEPGMGKTELCQQFRELARRTCPGLLVATGRCMQQYGPGEAYLPFLEALRSLLSGPHGPQVQQLIRQYAPTWCGQFPGFFAAAAVSPLIPDSAGAARDEPDRVSSPARMLRELGDALETLSASMPLLLVLDDMHWADPSSTDLLQLLAQRVGSWRVLLLVTLRSEELELDQHPLKNVRRELLAHDQCEELALPLLGRDSVSRYLDARFEPHALPGEFAESIVRMTEGQPLFATRLIQLLVEREDILQIDARWQLRGSLAELPLIVPASVRGVIERKLESLGEWDRRLLQYASVIGVVFDSASLASLLDMEEVSLEERLDVLTRVHHLVAPLGEQRLSGERRSLQYQFSHVLYRTVLYESVVSKRRELLHGQIAGRMLLDHAGDVSGIAAQLAHHFEAARDLERAIQYLRAAGDRAGHWHANREAKQHYTRALDLAQQLEGARQSAELVILAYNLGWCDFGLGEPEAALQRFEAMLEYARRPDFAGAGEKAERARELCFEYFEQPWRDAFGLCDMARMAHQDRALGASPFQCEAYSALTYVLSQLGRMDEMALRFAEFLLLAETTHNEPRRAEALGRMAYRQLELLELEDSARLLEQSIPLCRALGNQRALYVGCYTAGRVHHLRSEYAEAAVMHTEALALTFEVRGRIECQRRLGLARAHLGCLGAALGLLNEAYELARRAEFEQSLQLLAHARGWVLQEAGDEEGALGSLQLAAELADEHGFLAGRVRSLILLARVHTERGDPSQAEAALRQAEPLILVGAAESGQTPAERPRRTLWQLHFRAALAEHELARGEFEPARAKAQELLQAAVELGTPKHGVIARHLLGRIALGQGEFDAAELELRAGLSALDTHPIPILRWKLLTTQGFARLGAGDRAGASDAFARALASVEQIGGEMTEQRLRAVWQNCRAVQRLRAAAQAAA